LDSDVIFNSEDGVFEIEVSGVGSEDDLTFDGGLIKLAGLGNFVFEDSNKNGIQDAGEAGIGGVVVNLLDGNGNAVLDGNGQEITTLTEADGSYSFTDLLPGEYQVEFVTPDGYDFTIQDVGNDALDSDADPTTGKTATVTLSSGQFDDTIDAGLVKLIPSLTIDKKVKDPISGEFSDTEATFSLGSTITYGYFVENTGQVALNNITVVDDDATPGDPNDDVTLDFANGYVSGDTNNNGILDVGETWLFEYTKTAEFINPESLGRFPVSTTEMDKYLLIGTTSNSNAKAVNVQNGDLGANIIVLSDEINDNVDFDLDDVFRNNAGSQWVNVDNKHSAQSGNIGPDYLPGAAQVGEGVSWTGDVALTSPNAKFDMSNVELYAQRGVVAASNNPNSSVSNSEYFSDGKGNGFDTTGEGKKMPSNGVSTDTNAMAALRAQLDNFENYVTNLAPETTLTGNNGLPDFGGIEDEDYFELNVDQYDTNNDGIAVIDIKIDGGNSDFELKNSNWVIESEKGTFAIFRILGDSNLVLNQSTIVIGDGILGNKNATSPSGRTNGLGAIFVKANDYNDGNGGRNHGEALDSGDTTFSFNDTVLNGVGFYDLIEFSRDDLADGTDNPNKLLNFDKGNTELKINNGQGCSHFISPKINFNNVRFEHCAGAMEEQQTNIAEANGEVFGETVTSNPDDQTVLVSSFPTAQSITNGIEESDPLTNPSIGNGIEGNDPLTSPVPNVIEPVDLGRKETLWGQDGVADLFRFTQLGNKPDKIQGFTLGEDLVELDYNSLGITSENDVILKNRDGFTRVKVNGDNLVDIYDVTVAEVEDYILSI
ncbi:MAG: SdrD B-like domain-containing protein, partial [Microcystaceae cyanobacterium]